MRHFTNTQIGPARHDFGFCRQTDGCYYTSKGGPRRLVYRRYISGRGTVWVLAIDSKDVACFDGPRAAMRYAQGATGTIESEASP